MKPTISLRANVAANFLGQGWNALMGIAFLPLYVRYLGLESYGLLGVYALIQASLALLDLGMASTLSREMAMYKAGGRTLKGMADLLRSLELIAISICLLIAALVYLAADWIAVDWLQLKTIDPATASQAIAMMGAIVGLRLVEGLYRGAIIGLQEQVWLNGISALLATARWGGGALLVSTLAPTVSAYFLWQIVVSATAVAILARRTSRSTGSAKVGPSFSVDALRTVFTFAAGVSVSTGLAILLTQVDKMLLSKLLSLEDFGRYSFAAAIAGALLQLVIPVSHAYYPRYSEMVARGDIGKLAATYHGGAQLAHLILVPVALTMAMFARPIVEVWSGDAALASDSAHLLSLLALGTMLNGIMQTPYALTLAYGWSALSARLNFFAVALLVPTLLWAVPKYGAMGAAWVWLLLNAGYVIIGVHVIHLRLLPMEKNKWYVDDLMIPVFAASLVIVCAALMNPAPSIIYIFSAYLIATIATALSSSSIRVFLRHLKTPLNSAK